MNAIRSVIRALLAPLLLTLTPGDCPAQSGTGAIPSEFTGELVHEVQSAGGGGFLLGGLTSANLSTARLLPRVVIADSLSTQSNLAAPVSLNHTLIYQQSFFTVDLAAGTAPTPRPASGFGIVITGIMNSVGLLQLNGDAAAFQSLDAAGMLRVALPRSNQERYALVIVIPDSFSSEAAFPVHLDMIQILKPCPGSCGGTMSDEERCLVGPPVIMAEMDTITVDATGSLYINAQTFTSPALAGRVVDVGLIDETTAALWVPSLANVDPLLGGYALYFPTPVSAIEFTSSDLFIGKWTTGVPTSFAMFDADTGREIASGAITVGESVTLPFSQDVVNMNVVFHGLAPLPPLSAEPVCLLQPSHCQLIDYGCDIYHTMVSGTDTCTLNDYGTGYEQPPGDGSGMNVTVCEFKEWSDSTTVTYAVVDAAGLQISLPIPGAPVNFGVGTATTHTTSRTRSNALGQTECKGWFIPTGMILTAKSREWWCRYECGYCSGSVPNQVCFVGPSVYPDKEHYQTNGQLSGFQALGLELIPCARFTPGSDRTSEGCE